MKIPNGNSALTRCQTWGARRVVVSGLLLALAIEAVTAFLRFGLGQKASIEHDPVGALLFGLHIHHAYPGVLLGLTAWLWPGRHPTARKLLVIVAIGLVVSDLAHHFLVLWPLTGSPEFSIFYPRN